MRLFSAQDENFYEKNIKKVNHFNNLLFSLFDRIYYEMQNRVVEK